MSSIRFATGFLFAMTLAAGTAGATTPIAYESQTLFVYDNGVRCNRAPCPSYDVVTGAGVVTQATDLALASGAEIGIVVPTEGLIVEGYVAPPTPAGATYVIITGTTEPAHSFTLTDEGIVCAVSPCPSLSAVDQTTGERFEIAGLNLTLFVENLFSRLADGPVTVTGFVAEGSWKPIVGPGNLIYVTGVATPELN